jgi:hypothetical protein
VQFYVCLQVFGDTSTTAITTAFLFQVGILPNIQQKLLQAYIYQFLASSHRLAKTQVLYKTTFRQKSLTYQ